MKLARFKHELRKIGYYADEREKGKLYIAVDEDHEHASDWCDYTVAKVLTDEQYGVYYDYCIPFTKQLNDLVYEFICTPLDQR